MKRFLWLLVFVFVMNSVLGIEGVSPGSYSVDFKEGLQRDFTFNFTLDSEKDLKVRGDLAEYVKLDKKRVLGKDMVVATLSLPEVSDYFGVSNIWILAGSVAGIIKVNVPYPDRYVRLDLAIPNVNVEEDIIAKLKVSNFGKEDLNVRPIVKVYSNEILVGTFEGDERLMRVSGTEDYEFNLSSKGNEINFSAGEYLAVVSVDEFKDRDVFKIGEFKLKILNYTREVKEGIEKFNVEVESLWDDKMKEVYAEVRVISGQRVSNEIFLEKAGGFDSSIVSLGGWEKRDLVGYFDSSGLEGDVLLNISVHYSPVGNGHIASVGAVESRVVKVYIEKSLSWIPWTGLVFVLIFLFWWLWSPSK